MSKWTNLYYLLQWHLLESSTNSLLQLCKTVERQVWGSGNAVVSDCQVLTPLRRNAIFLVSALIERQPWKLQNHKKCVSYRILNRFHLRPAAFHKNTVKNILGGPKVEDATRQNTSLLVIRGFRLRRNEGASRRNEVFFNSGLLI